MTSNRPQIRDYMTKFPITIDADASVYQAMTTMEELDIRHLPVLEAGVLKGVITDRDLKTLFTFLNPTQGPKHILVGDVCTDQPYIARPDAFLSDVALVMSEKKYGSAVVVEDGVVVGLFTTVDACSALATLCEQKRIAI